MKIRLAFLFVLLPTLLLAQQTAEKQFTLTVGPAPLAITSTTLPGGNLKVAYSAQLAVSGGTAPYTWSQVTAAPFPAACSATPAPGPLPSGLTLSASGLISGTPTAQGTFPLCFTVKDSSGTIAARRFGGKPQMARGKMSAGGLKVAAKK